jgi:hypothetical protein
LHNTANAGYKQKMAEKRKRNNKKVRIINLGKIRDKRGNLSVVESGISLPFEIARTYWVYDVPGGEARQGHAYYKSEEFMSMLRKVTSQPERFVLKQRDTKLAMTVRKVDSVADGVKVLRDLKS